MQRISVLHFLNEVLRNEKVFAMNQSKAFFEYANFKEQCAKEWKSERMSIVKEDKIDYKELQKQLGIL